MHLAEGAYVAKENTYFTENNMSISLKIRAEEVPLVSRGKHIFGLQRTQTRMSTF